MVFQAPGQPIAGDARTPVERPCIASTEARRAGARRRDSPGKRELTCDGRGVGAAADAVSRPTHGGGTTPPAICGVAPASWRIPRGGEAANPHVRSGG